MSNLRSLAILTAAMCSQPAEAMPERYKPFPLTRADLASAAKEDKTYFEPVTQIDEKCRQEALKTYGEVMETIMSQDFLIGSHLRTAGRVAGEVREECLDSEIAEYCATTGDMKYMEYETDITTAQAAHIADEAQALCTDEMNVNLKVL